MGEATTSRATVTADGPHGVFYDFYSASLENFGHHLVFPVFEISRFNTTKTEYALIYCDLISPQ